MLVVMFIALVFRRFSATPIIKASGRELSYLLLFGIFLSFSLTFVIVAKPTAITCGLTRFFLGRLETYQEHRSNAYQTEISWSLFVNSRILLHNVLCRNRHKNIENCENIRPRS